MGGPSKHRKRKPLLRNLTLVISIVLWSLLTCVGYWSFSADQAESGLWGCEMAYMYPSFLPLEGVDDTGSRYALYLYREGGIDPTTPSGHPVIFIPGNAGSYKQARSIGASVAAQFHRGRDSSWTKGIDVFTVDFNEDFSALHAPTLRSQARFVAKAITRVLRAYDHLPVGERPSKVTLLGHSMGGIVARLTALLAQPTLAKPSPMDVIITMSTPHLWPPAPLDYDMEQIYDEINAVSYSDPSPLLFSICGGTSDIQIVSDACALSDNLVGPNDGFAVFSTGIPGVWTGVEHQAIVWCDQMRFRVARALLEMGEAPSRQQKLSAARQWLLGRSSNKPALPTLDGTTRIDPTSPKMSVLVKLSHPIERSLVDPPLSVHFCRAEGGCSDQAFSKYTVPWLAMSERPFPLLGEGSRLEDSVFVLDFDLPDVNGGWLKIRHPLGASVHSGPHLKQDVAGSHWAAQKGTSPVHISLHFSSPVVSSIVAYRLTVETEDCSDHMSTVQFTSSPALPFDGPSHETRFYPTSGGSAILHSHISGSPFQGYPQSSRGIDIDIYQHPRCRVRSVSLSVDPYASLAKAMLRLRIAVLLWCTGWIATILFLQLTDYASDGSLPSFSEVVEERMPKLSILAAGLCAIALVVQHLGSTFGIPTGSLFLGLTRVTYLPFMLLAALWSWGTVALVHALQQASFHLLARVLHIKQNKRARGSETTLNRWTVGSRVVSGLTLLGLISIVVPYRLAFGILFIVQFILTAYASSDDQPSRRHLMESLVLLMTFLLPFNLPALAVWGKNFWIHGQHAFPEDRAILPVLPSLVMVMVSSFERPLAAATAARQAARWGAAFVAVVAFSFAPGRPYILGSTVNVVFICASVLMTISAPSPGGQGEVDSRQR